MESLRLGFDGLRSSYAKRAIRALTHTSRIALLVITILVLAALPIGAMPTGAEAASTGGALLGVTALSSTDAWAVGWFSSSSQVLGLAKHWDGQHWAFIPNVAGGAQAQLYGVAGVASNDVWMVGAFWTTDQPLTLHWDGTAPQVVSVPSPGNYVTLYGVAALSSDNVWAVGTYTPISDWQSKTLVEHWDGTSWQRFPSPNMSGTSNVLTGIRALAPNDIWAVGYTYQGPLTLHFDGALWKIVQNGGSSTSFYHGVSGTSSNDVWAVGTAGATLTSHWNGSTWTRIASPNPGQDGNGLNAVAAIAPNDAWAVGTYFGATSNTLTLHWNGSAWSQVSSPGAGKSWQDNILYGVAAVSSDDVWAVGKHTGPMIIHWNGTNWTVSQ